MRQIHRAFIVVFGLILGLAPRATQAQSYVFGTANFPAPVIISSSPPLGNVPMIAADFNGDGITDLALLGSSSGQQDQTTGISILLGKPDGTFAPMVNYPVEASGFTVGDFNGDGKLDIITISNVYFPVATILLGNGDGTFQAPATLNLGVGNGLYSLVASTDFNGDGKLDLVLLSPNFGTGATMAVLLGNGDGTFAAAVTYQVPVAPYLLIGDFNGDGKPDIAIAGPNDESGEPNLIVVLINNGEGTFQSPVQYSVTGVITSMAIADMNGDGKLDLVVCTSGQIGGVSVLLGIGDGTFASPITYTSTLLSIYGASLAVADFNDDGKLDLALNNSSSPDNAVAILLGKGDGTFQAPPVLYSAGLSPAGLIALDVNGDGKPDLAVWGGYFILTYYSVTVLINQGDGGFPHGTTYPVIQYPWSAVLGDFNGDGKTDIAIGSITANSGGSDTGGVVSVLPGNGDGTFQTRVDTPTSNYPEVMAAGDFNHDGKLDLVVVEATSTGELLSTWIGNGDGTFQNSISQGLGNNYARSLAVGDFNHDGKLDVAASVDSAGVDVFLGKGDGTFAAPQAYAVQTATNSAGSTLVTADFNGDGKLDLAVTTSQGISILPGKGDGTFGTYTPILPGEAIVAIGGFNGDGKPDLVIATGNNIVSVALGKGDGTFTQAASYQLPSILSFGSPIVGDFNGDGKLDIAFASQSTDVVTILFGNGDGTFSGHMEFGTAQIAALVAADFNGDGALDLAMTNVTNQVVSVFLKSPVAALSPSHLNFGSQGLGTPSAEQTISMSNPSPVAISLSSLVAGGDFSANDDCGSTLKATASCQVKVTFTPTADGNRTGLLAITDNVPGSPQQVPLTGTGTGPIVELAPTSLTFPTQNPGTSSSAQNIKLTNSGNVALTIKSIAASGDFEQTNTCGSSVNSGASCTISVTFKPTQAGSRTGEVTITDSAFNSPQTAPLTGTGTGPVVSLSSPLTFAAQLVGTPSNSQTVTLTNTGNANLTLTAMGATGPFAIASSGTSCLLSNPVAALGACTVAVTFTPAAAGAASGSLSFGDNAPGSPQAVTLNGTGMDFTLSIPSGSSSTASVSPGQMASYSLSLSGLGGMNEAINFTCAGAPSEATCSVSPTSATPNASGSVALSVTVTTTASSMVAPPPRRTLPPGPGMKVLLISGLVIIALTLPWLALRRMGRQRRSRKLPWGLVTAALVVLALAMTACGGGGGGGGGGGPTNPGTPAGTYTLTITGTASGSSTLKHSMTLTLTVS